jgi:dihydroneopterin aldolase
MAHPAQSPRDSLVLRGLVFYGYHGVLAEEQKLGQRFQVDLRLWMDLQAAARSDDLADTVSYAAVFDQVRAVLEGPPSRLLEHVAGRVGAALLAADPRIARVRVRLLKLDPPIAAMSNGQAGVVLHFTRES